MAPKEELGAGIDGSCQAARAAGNSAYAAGDLVKALECYKEAMAACEKALADEEQPKALEVGQLVRYSEKGYFGTVMSVFPLFDEYFIKDIGSDQAIWVGDPGGSLRRFARTELSAVKREHLDFRLAVLQNLAAVTLRQENFDQTVRWADLALCIQGRSPKALMRKGAALLRLNQPGPASDVLATAAEEVQNDAEVRRLLREAEKRRSPTWVCVTGCCGPWGIVCGGPVAEAMPQVVAPAGGKPAAAPSAATAGAAGDELRPSATVPVLHGAPDAADDAGAGSSTCTGAVGEESDDGDDEESEERQDNLTVPSPAQAANRTATAAADGGGVAQKAPRLPPARYIGPPPAASSPAGAGGGGGGDGGAAAAAPQPRPQTACQEAAAGRACRDAACKEPTAEARARPLAATAPQPMEKGVVGLLWLAAVSAVVAAMAGLWMVAGPSGKSL